jgi:hypothetical protein
MPHHSIAPEATTPPQRAYFRRLEICEHFRFCSRTFDRLRAEGVIPPPEIHVGSHKNKRPYGLWSSDQIAQVEAAFRDNPAPPATVIKPARPKPAKPRKRAATAK